MSDSGLTELSLNNLGKLVEIYRKDWPKHIVILSTLNTFAKQFKLFPELKERMKLFALSDDWEIDGRIYATVSATVTSEHD